MVVIKTNENERHNKSFLLKDIRFEMRILYPTMQRRTAIPPVDLVNNKEMKSKTINDNLATVLKGLWYAKK